MRPLRLLLAGALLAGCGETSLASFGQLRNPVALAVHEPTANVFIASLGGDELRVFNARSESFLLAPAALFPLSIPTVRNPTALAAADRYVFVLSGPDAALAFVDTEVPAGAVGPRSVDVAGFPVTLPLDLLPSDLVAFSASWAWGPDGLLADHALVAGLDESGEGGALIAVRPPVVEGTEIVELPLPEAVLELPGIYPAAVAIDPSGASLAGLRGPDGTPVVDCRPIAIADGRYAPEAGHAPAVWLTSVRVQPDGSLSIDPLDPAARVEIRAEVVLADGSVEERIAPVRDVAFAPAPLTDQALAALAADPCAPRSGRLYAALDPAFCLGTRACPDVAVIDLAGPGGPGLAADASGLPALYDLPATILRVDALAGPFDLPGAFVPHAVGADGENLPVDALPALGLLASSNGSLYYLGGGLGPYLVGPAPDVRAASAPAFLVDGESTPPGLVGELIRTDLGPAAPAAVPEVTVPPDASPRDASWLLAHLEPLPGLEEVGRVSAIDANGILRAPAAIDFLAPVAVLADADPRKADRLVPVGFDVTSCEGFPIVEVEADFLRVDLEAPLQNDEGCFEPGLALRILPPLDSPWWVTSSATGFAGRLQGATAGDRPASRVFAGDELQFVFTPPAEAPPAGATFEFATTDGFVFYRAAPGDFAELPASVAPVLLAGPRAGRDPDWRVYVAYSGTDSLAVLRPAAPDDVEFFQ